MIRSLLRHYYKVGVSHTVAMDKIADTLEREGVAHAAAKFLGDEYDSLCDVIREVDEVIDVRFRDYQAFTRRCRLQRHECSYHIVLVDKARGRLSRDYLAEDTTHAS